MTATSSHRMEAEDTALALLRFTSGALGTIVASTAVYPGFAQQLEITGTNGTVIIEDGRIARADLRTGGYNIVVSNRQLFHRDDVIRGGARRTANMIHDVEVDRAMSADRPAITFFLCSETTRVPNSYMVPSMAEFHRGHPDLTRQGKALDLEAWDAKLTTCDSVRS